MNLLAGKVTLKDVAQLAGVAESTASRALHGNGHFASGTREKVLDAAAQLGYIINTRSSPSAQSDTQRSGLIGVVVAALNNSFYPYLVDRLHNELEDRGFNMVLIVDEITHDKVNRKLQSLIDDTLDGVIVATAMIDSPMVEYLLGMNVPTVLAIRSNMRNDVHVVESDNFAAGVEAMEHLVDLGHRRIGFLMGPANTSTTTGRLQGAKSVLDQAGIGFDQQCLHHSEYSHEGGYSGCVHLLRRAEPPTAIFCANDVIAIGALDAAKKMGINIPSGVSIIGVDDIPMASWGMISLTTVRQPIGEIGVMSARLIVDIVRKNADLAPSHHILPTSLIKRATTAPPSVAER